MIRLLLAAAILSTLPAAAWGQALRDSPTLPRQKKTPVVPVTTPAHSPDLNRPESTIEVSDSLQQYLTHLVVEEIPRQYENTKKWGGTKRVMSGLDWELDGIKVETRRQWKEANHGTWSRYKLTLIDPEKTFQIRLENLKDLGGNTASFDLIGIASVDCTGRMSQWQRGVQLISLSADAEAKVRLTAHVEVTMGLDPRTLPPDILLAPKVISADLKLEEFRLQRVSKAEGPLAHAVGEVVEEGIQEYLAENRDRLAEKMNKAIAKKQDKLRIPVSKLTTSAWGEWFESFLAKPKE